MSSDLDIVIASLERKATLGELDGLLLHRATVGFYRRKIRSVAGLVEGYDRLSKDEKLVALWVLGTVVKFHDKWRGRAVALALGEVKGRSAELRGTAVLALANCANAAEMQNVVEELSSATDENRKICLIQSVAFWAGTMRAPYYTRAAEVLCRILSDTRASSRCRCTAAEALGPILKRVGRRTNSYSAAILALMSALSSRSRSVRLFSIFTLGELRERKSLRMLEELEARCDQTRQGMLEVEGSVRAEASIAIQKILGKEPGHPGGQT
jgi:hypothetical protein